MIYNIEITEVAENDIRKLRKSGDKALLKKLNLLFDELREHPYTGSGQIEQLKFFKEPTFSRRINREHRLVYRVYDDTVVVIVLSCFGHYV
ncbi:MAG: Txe/YoeB family addiction module toxin [Candidatus Kapabacteria bacterium]|nr:Txe/YoeB family addiction module toxin [Candidatus Kapabacteria bacterium]